MNARASLLLSALIFGGALSGCTGHASPGVIPYAPTTATSQLAAPTAVRDGTSTLLLMIDRQHLVPGSQARIVGFGPYGTTQKFSFYVTFPGLTSNLTVRLHGIASDPAGRIYVSLTTICFVGGLPVARGPYGKGAVAVFDSIPASSKPVAPNAIVYPKAADFSAGSLGSVDAFPAIINVDAQNRLYAGSAQGLAVFPARANGPTLPIAWKSFCPESVISIALDGAANPVVACNGDIRRLRAGDYSFTPQSIISADGNVNNRPYIAVGRDGSIYAATNGNDRGVTPGVNVYAPGIAGESPAPIRRIGGYDHAKIANPIGIEVCSDGRTYVAQLGGYDGGISGRAGILVFAAGADGDVAPVRVLAPGDTTIAGIGF